MSGPLTTGFDRILPVPPVFLWRPYLRAGNLNLLSGDGGSGKTTLALLVAAALADGVQPAGMPGALSVDAARGSHTLILSFEDEAEELRFRLDGCGCRHPERVHTLTPDGIAPLLTDAARLTALVEECGASLLVIDPVQAFLQAGADANSMSDVRRALESLRGVCRKTGCAALLIAHLNKSAGRSAMQRTSGSMDFVNAVRSAMMVVPHPRTADTRCAFHFKSNGAAPGETLSFRLGDGARAGFAGVCDLDREELERGGRPPRETDSSPARVRRLMERLALNLTEWTMSAAELAARPENTEGLTPKTIAFCLERAAEDAGWEVRRSMQRHTIVYKASLRPAPSAG